MKKLKIIVLALVLITVLTTVAITLALPSSAETSGYYTYTVSNGEATITDVDTSISGDIAIPDELGGYPVTSIGNYAFYNCTSLESITIPNSVKSIGYGAFNGCTSLTSITIPDSITSIGDSAFSGCTSLTSITIPDSITSIGDYAFSGCTSFTSITIPDSITSIGDYAFSGCTCITSITIPDSITSIGSYAFKGCTSLTSVTIPASVTSMGYLPFYNCRKLVEVYNLSRLYISKASISSGYHINSDLVDIYTSPESKSKLNTTDDECLFYEDDDAIYLIGYVGSDTVLTLPDDYNGKNYQIYFYAFENCTTLKQITLPDSITEIQSGTFLGCTELEKVSIGNNIEFIHASAFSGCTKLIYNEYGNGCYLGNDNNQYVALIKEKSTDITTCTIHEDTKFIVTNAFYGCNDLFEVNYNATSALYPNTLAAGAFCGAGSDTIGITVNIATNVKKIPDALFSHDSYSSNQSNQSNVTTIIFAENSQCKSIGDATFLGCSNLESITIPDSVESIAAYAFCGCTSLESITIPNNVKSIGSRAFSDCTSLKNITVEDGNVVYHSSGNCLIETATKTLIAGCKNSIIPTDGSVTIIGNDAFYYCTSLESIAIPNSVYSIGEYAFYYCTSLESIAIPNSVYSIGEYAFYKCTNLESIIIPEHVTNIGDNTFYYCTSLESITIPDGIMNIGDYAFYNCASLINVTIPTSVTSIGKFAFSYCTALTEINFNATAMNDLPSDNRVFECAGQDDEGITVNIGANVTIIPARLFCPRSPYGNPTSIPKIVDIVFATNSQCTLIGESAFEGCIKNTNLTIPQSVIYINSWAFSHCENLTIYCYSGSTAHTYARNNSIDFVLIYDENNEIPIAPTVRSTTETSVTLTPISGYEYKIEGGEWQRSNVFSGLTLNTTYTFYQRIAKTNTVLASVDSEAGQFATNNHDFTAQCTENQYLVSAADCTHKAVYYYSCQECGLVHSTTFEYGEAFGHDFSVDMHDETHHWHKCNRCTETDTKNAHEFTAQRTTEEYLLSNADCTHKAVYYFSCQECGLKHTTTFEHGEFIHDFSINEHDETHHWQKCSRCNEINNKEVHAGGSATCLEKAICNICNIAYEEALGHNFSINVNDAESHWHKCATCGATDTKENHTFGTNKKCTVCDYKIKDNNGYNGNHGEGNNGNGNQENNGNGYGNKKDNVEETTAVSEKEPDVASTILGLGCGSTVGGSLALIATLGVAAAFIGRKKKSDE